MKIVEVSQSHVVGRGVGWLGWLRRSNFFYWLISRVDYQDELPCKVSTQYLKVFRSYPIEKIEQDDDNGHISDTRPVISGYI